MLKKRNLIIFVMIVMMFIVGSIDTIKQVVAAKNESPQMIEVCQNELSSDRQGYTFYECDNSYRLIKYIRTESSLLSINVYFVDGTNTMWCQMQQVGSKWIVIGTASTLASPCL